MHISAAIMDVNGFWYLCKPGVLIYTQQNSYTISHLRGTVTGQWQCSHCWQLPAAQWQSPCWCQLTTLITLSLSSHLVVTVLHRWLMEKVFGCVFSGGSWRANSSHVRTQEHYISSVQWPCHYTYTGVLALCTFFKISLLLCCTFRVMPEWG